MSKLQTPRFAVGCTVTRCAGRNTRTPGRKKDVHPALNCCGSKRTNSSDRTRSRTTIDPTGWTVAFDATTGRELPAETPEGEHSHLDAPPSIKEEEIRLQSQKCLHVMAKFSKDPLFI
jgi:hypothetical protein